MVSYTYQDSDHTLLTRLSLCFFGLWRTTYGFFTRYNLPPVSPTIRAELPKELLPNIAVVGAWPKLANNADGDVDQASFS